MTQNSDRTNTKPNLLTNGETVVALDHEISFGFVFTPFLTPRVWEMQENHKVWIRNHCLLPLIKGRPYDYEAFIKRLDHLNEQFWQKASQLIPPEWITQQFNKIKDVLSMVIANKESFNLELKRIMS